MEDHSPEPVPSAATLERVVSIAQKREVEGKFFLALASMEFYGEAGCVIQYSINVDQRDLSDLPTFAPTSGNSVLWSDVEHRFSVRDEGGTTYRAAMGSGGSSFWEDHRTEYYSGFFSCEPVGGDANEITVSLESLVRNTAYGSGPEAPPTEEEEVVSTVLWEGPLDFTFAV